jgi:hypothetical protein
MAIYRLLQQSAFTPEQIIPMAAAYEDCLRILKLADRSDPITEIVAKAIIEIVQMGERDPVRIRQLALKRIDSASD